MTVGRTYPFAAPFVWRFLSGSTVAPFPHSAHRTGLADLPHPALGQDLTPSSTPRRAPAVSARLIHQGERKLAPIPRLPFASNGGTRLPASAHASPFG